MQNDFCSPGGHFARNGKDVSAVRAVIPRISELLSAARRAGVLVLFTKQSTLPNLASDSPAWLYFKTRDGKAPDYTVAGSPGEQIVQELQPLEAEMVVRKFRPTAFLGTELDLLLRNHQIQTVAVAGCLTQGCVQATALDASFHDYYTVVIEDCVQSTSQEQHENALRFLRSRYDVLPRDAVASIWLSSPRDPGARR